MERDVQHRSFRTSSRTNAVLAAGKGCRIAQDDQLFLVEEVTGPHVEPLPRVGSRYRFSVQNQSMLFRVIIVNQNYECFWGFVVPVMLAAPLAGRPALNGSTTEAQEDERFEVTERIAIFRPRRKSAADMLLEQYTAFGDRTQVIADGSRKAPEQPCDLVLGQPYTAISELGFHLPVADGFFGNFDILSILHVS